MLKKALVVIDIQNDMTVNCKEIIDNVNKTIDWAINNEIHVVYTRRENYSTGTRTFKSNTREAEFAPDLKIVSDNVFTKSKGNALMSEEFTSFVDKNEISDFYIVGADAVACVKSTCYNLSKMGYNITVLSDCIISYDIKKFPEMSEYYKNYYNKKGSKIISLNDLVGFETQ
jgi:nicotinamidase-related amidase